MSTVTATTMPVVRPLDALLFGFPVEFTIYMFVFAFILTFDIFFSGRVIGLLVSRLWQRAWGKHYFVRIGAINFALVGGRIIFRELVYSTQNTVLRVVSGSVTLRWWSFDVRQSLHDDAKKQCRLEIRLNGLEYFLYNNIGRYKRMRRLLAKKKADADGNVIVDLPEFFDAAQLALPGYFKLFPIIGIHLNRCAIMVGNPELPTIALLTAPNGVGVYGCDKCDSQLDGYKWVIGLQLLNVVSKLIPNNEYSGDQEIAVDDDQGNSMAERFRSLYEDLVAPAFLSTNESDEAAPGVVRKPRTRAPFYAGTAK